MYFNKTNPYFIVEVVRALAEEAGQLADIGKTGLPHTIAAQGVRAVLDRRLSRVPSSGYELLRSAAVAGRQLDLQVLRQLAPHVDAWLEVCSDAAVLEVSESQWRFSHDKLRERLLDALAPDERKKLHRQVARAIEQAYPQSRERAADLFYHFSQAGADEEAAPYAVLAGECALGQGALEEAVRRFQAALALKAKLLSPPQESKGARLGLARALYALGRLSESTENYEQLLRELGMPIPKSKLQLAGALVREAGCQLSYRLRASAIPAPQDEKERHWLEEIAGLLGELGPCYHFLGRIPETLLTSFICTNLADRIQDPGAIVYYYSGMYVLLSITPLHRFNSIYLSTIEKNLSALDDPKHATNCGLILLVIYIGQANWKAAQEAFDKGIAAARKQCNHVKSLIFYHSIVYMQYAMGNYNLMRQSIESYLALARQISNPQHTASALAWQSILLLKENQIAPANEFIEKSALELKKNHDVFIELFVYSTQALCALNTGNVDRAAQLAEKALIASKENPPIATSAEGYSTLVEVYFELWTRASNLLQKALYRHKFCKVLQSLWICARGQVAKPRAHLWQGRYELENHHPKRALYHFQTALAHARNSGLPHDVALASHFLRQLEERQPIHNDA